MVKSRLRLGFIALALMALLTLLSPPLVRQVEAVANLISISPATGPVGTKVTVVGTVAGGASFRIHWDNPTTGQILASGVTVAGAVNSEVTIPAGASGVVHNIYLVDVSDSTNNAIAFTITPAISISSSSGVAGAGVTVTGTGFAASETGIKVTWDGVDLAVVGAANATGGWTKAVTIPNSVGGVHLIGAYGATTLPSAVAQVNYTVIVGFTVGPSSGPQGTVATANGTGFAGGETGIQVLWDGIAGFPIRTGISANAFGAWSATFVVPASTAGLHNIDARGPTTGYEKVPDTAFMVTGDLFLNSIVPSTGPVGASVTVTGRVTAGASYWIRWDDPVTGLILGRGASVAGDVTKVVTIPAGASAVAHNIYLVDVTDSTAASPMNASLPFAITPAISTSLARGKAGDTITLTGTGFAASETGIKATWDWRDLVPVGAASATGDWTKTITVPADYGGLHYIGARGDVTVPVDVMEVQFTMLRNLTINPASGPVGTTVTASGTGFAAEETGIQVLWGGVAGYAVKTDITASLLGAWSATFTVPASVSGDHVVDAWGSVTPLNLVPDGIFAVNRKLLISPASGYGGASVAITGTGYKTSAAITVTYDGVPLAAMPAAVASTSDGNVSATFIVPVGSAGAHSVAVSDGVGSAAATFTITSSVTSSAASGQVGTPTTLTGVGFPPRSNISVTYDGSPMKTTPETVTTDAAGAVSFTFVAPESVRGAHAIVVSSGAFVLNTTFTVSPSLAVTPAAGTAGSAVTLSGKGFASGAPITVTLDNVVIATSPTPLVASPLGSFSASITLPGPRQTHTIAASDGVGSAQGTFDVMPGVTLSQATVKIGAMLVATGTGFRGAAGISVTIDGAAAVVDPSPLLTDASGGFSVQVTVPPGAAGSHSISFSDGVQSVSATYGVMPSLSVSPAVGNMGSAVSLVGAGFAASKPVSVTYDGNPITPGPAPVTTTAQGGFRASLTIPVSKAGQHVIAVSDGSGNTLQATFTLESVSPPAPLLSAPASGSTIRTFGSGRPTFAWSEVSVPGGVTYTLQVSRSPSFVPLVLEKSGLKIKSYNVESAQALGRGYYYWRVRVVDNASNEGGWSQTFTLRIGTLPPWMPTWLLIVFIIVALGIVVGAVYVLRLSRRR